MVKTQGNNIVSINGNLLYKAMQAGDTLCLAAFISLSYHLPHKRFSKGQLSQVAALINVSTAQLYRYIAKMAAYNLIEKRAGKYYLSSISQIHAFYGGANRVSAFCPKEVILLGIKSIQKLLKSIPIISCAKAQQRAINRKENHVQIRQAKSERNGRVTAQALRSLRRFEAKNGSDFQINSQLQISIQGIANLLGCCKATAIRRKRHLHNCGVITFKRVFETLVYNVPPRAVNYFRFQGTSFSLVNEFDEEKEYFKTCAPIPKYFRYDKANQIIYVDRCSTITLTYLNHLILPTHNPKKNKAL